MNAFHRLWRCFKCGKAESVPITNLINPWCCDREMKYDRDLFSIGDQRMEQLDLVECAAGDDYRAPESVFQIPLNWDPAYELWVLRQGRMNGERIGWLGRTLLGWYYQMVPGIPEILRNGFKPTRDEAIAAMRYAIEGR